MFVSFACQLSTLSDCWSKFSKPQHFYDGNFLLIKKKAKKGGKGDTIDLISLISSCSLWVRVKALGPFEVKANLIVTEKHFKV